MAFRFVEYDPCYSWISHAVTAAMLVSRSNPPGIESYYYANVFFCFR